MTGNCFPFGSTKIVFFEPAPKKAAVLKLPMQERWQILLQCARGAESEQNWYVIKYDVLVIDTHF